MGEQLAFTAPAQALTRPDALHRLAALVGRDLRALAPLYGVTFEREGQRNKGWAGQVVERFLGLPPDALQRPDFGDWELKVVPIHERADGVLVPRETMAITMFNEDDLERLSFDESHLLEKLRRQVVVARIFLGPEESRSLVLACVPFDLDDPALLAEIAADYEEIRWVARTAGLPALTARIGRWVQPRPKGEGHGRGGHGFYAKKALIARMLGLSGAASPEDDPPDAASGLVLGR